MLRACHLQPLWNPINGNDLISAEHIGTANGKLPYWSTAPDGDGIASLDVAVFSSHIAGGKDIGQKQDLLVRRPAGILTGPTSAKGTRMYSACPPAYPPYIWE